MLAWSLANGLEQFSAPIFAAFYPRFSKLVASGKLELLIENYRRGTQLTALILIPLGMTLAIFSENILNLWARDPNVTENAHFVLSLLAVGTMMHGLMSIPYGLQLAYGWTSLAFYVNMG